MMAFNAVNLGTGAAWGAGIYFLAWLIGRMLSLPVVDPTERKIEPLDVAFWTLCGALVGTIATIGMIGIARKRIQGDRRQEWFLWCLGSALFTTVVASFGINFSVHLFACFASLLVCVSVAILEVRRATVRRELVPAELESAPGGGRTDLLLGETRKASWYHVPEAH